jgi:hypothetical protein
MKTEFGANSKFRQFRGGTSRPIQFQEFPASCEVIGSDAFENCNRLQALMFVEGSKLAEFRMKISRSWQSRNQRKCGLDSTVVLEPESEEGAADALAQTVAYTTVLVKELTPDRPISNDKVKSLHKLWSGDSQFCM